MAERFANTRLGRQELGGELLPDTPGALWTVELLERCRSGASNRTGSVRVERSRDTLPSEAEGRSEAGLPPPSPHESTTFVRVVIAVDPPSGDGTCGIVACARDEAGRGHVLADHSVTARSPEGWAIAVADAANVHAALLPFGPTPWWSPNPTRAARW
jgi:phage terminase large subunit-like protein